MKFGKADIEQFNPITITLETELEYKVMKNIFAANPETIANACICITADNVRKCFDKDANNTAYNKLTVIRSR